MVVVHVRLDDEARPEPELAALELGQLDEDAVVAPATREFLAFTGVVCEPTFDVRRAPFP
jgi:hypothetical protein